MQTQYHFSPLLTDWLLYVLIVLTIIAIFWIRHQTHLREPWSQVFQRRLGMIAATLLIFYVGVGVLDSIHFRVVKINKHGQVADSDIHSVFDLIISPLGQNDEKTYSAPFSKHLFSQSLISQPNGKEARGYAALKYVELGNEKHNILVRSGLGLAIGIIISLFTLTLLLLGIKTKNIPV